MHWLVELQDENTINQLCSIKEGQDWWQQISDQERQAIDEGIAQLDRGEGIEHQQAMQQLRGRQGI